MSKIVRPTDTFMISVNNLKTPPEVTFICNQPTPAHKVAMYLGSVLAQLTAQVAQGLEAGITGLQNTPNNGGNNGPKT